MNPCYKALMQRPYLPFFALLLIPNFVLAASPVDELKAWLSKSQEEREPMNKREFSSAALTKEQAKQAIEVLWADTLEQLKKDRAEEFASKVVSHGDHKMKFDFREFGEAPEGGHSLFISMHGGGGAPAEVNERQWKNQIGLYKPKEGYYMAPRAPSDTWNLWHRSHIDPLFDRLIEDFVAIKGVNPNRIYLMGYSAGGDGVYQLAPRMSDRFAAVAMMAGHPNETQPTGLRNLPFTLHMGGNDAAYKRNAVAAQWKEKLAELQKGDPEGYPHHVEIHEGKGHWMEREDAVAIPWMQKFTRNPWPKKIVWLQDDVTHDRFYWLSLSEGEAKGRQLVEAEVRGQKIVLTPNENAPGKVFLRLHDALIDLDQPIEVFHGEKSLFKGSVRRSIGIIAKSLSERKDPHSASLAEQFVDFAPDSDN